jgi:hypothetical protein
MHRGQVATIQEQSYRWLATFLSLWLAFGYFGLALFYPLMCSPYWYDTAKSIDQTTAFAHTITPFSVVLTAPVWPLYIASEGSGTWLWDSHEDNATGVALTFINVISVPAAVWLHGTHPLRTMSDLDVKSYKDFTAVPPERPPRLF